MATRSGYRRVPWDKGKIVGQKAPLKLREIWAIRVRLQLRSNLRNLALFNSSGHSGQLLQKSILPLLFYKR